MFSGLRLRLTLLYLVVGTALLLTIGGGTYVLLRRYFISTTDQALEHKMAHEFHVLRAPIPASLLAADRDWSLQRDQRNDDERRVDSDDDRREIDWDEREGELAFDGELAAIFVLPLSAEGRLLFDPNPATAPIPPDREAARVAMLQGRDHRTIMRSDGVRVRLLTYRLTRDDGPALLQLGRTLADQDRVLAQLTGVMLGLGLLSAAALGVGSWWLAGRALGPAQEAWNRQRTFIANASHELRTPLTLLRASAEVALRGLPPDDRDQRELLGDIVQESDHMTRLVDDLLLLSRLDAGRLELHCERLAVDEVLCEVYREVDRLARERGVDLQCRHGGGVVSADRTRLRQVLLALLDNALRHTPAGGSIELRSQIVGRNVAIAVQDTGSGIAPEHLAQLFTRFYRVDSARSGDGGAGLGLSIAQALVEAQQGRVSVESEVGSGSTFTVLLPLQA